MTEQPAGHDPLQQPIEALLQPVLADLESYEPGPEARSRPSLRDVPLRDYEIVRPLGRGGMGRTLLARERATGWLVCIKELRSRLACSERQSRATCKPGTARRRDRSWSWPSATTLTARCLRFRASPF